LSGNILFLSVFLFNFIFILSVPLEPPLKVNVCFQFLFSTCFGAVCRKNCWYCSSALDTMFLHSLPNLVTICARIVCLHFESRLVRALRFYSCLVGLVLRFLAFYLLFFAGCARVTEPCVVLGFFICVRVFVTRTGRVFA